MRSRAKNGFTLLEMMIAMALSVIAMMVAYVSFSAVSKAWQRGVALSDRISHGDYIMEQIVEAVRSTYFHGGADGSALYGFTLDNNGSGSDAKDEMSWVKEGRALVEGGSGLLGGPHRVLLSVEANTESYAKGLAIAVRVWRAYGQPDEFRPSSVKPMLISGKITGFNCRIATNTVNDRVDWHSNWEDTNRIPAAVELTLYMEPLDKGMPPLKIQRAVSLPVSTMGWTF